MSYIGVVEDGKVLLPPGAEFPSGTKVKVEALPEEQQATTMTETLKDFIGIFHDLPTDLARNHDHYLHGTPKR